MEWQDIIKQAFFNAWQQNSEVDITDYLYIIGKHFDLPGIELRILNDLSKIVNGKREVKKQVAKLQELANDFVLALLETSDDGKSINKASILKARKLIFEKAGCPNDDGKLP